MFEIDAVIKSCVVGTVGEGDGGIYGILVWAVENLLVSVFGMVGRVDDCNIIFGQAD